MAGTVSYTHLDVYKRQILLPSETVEILKQYKAGQTIESEYVFPSPTGGIMEPDLSLIHI